MTLPVADTKTRSSTDETKEHGSGGGGLCDSDSQNIWPFVGGVQKHGWA